MRSLIPLSVINQRSSNLLTRMKNMRFRQGKMMNKKYHKVLLESLKRIKMLCGGHQTIKMARIKTQSQKRKNKNHNFVIQPLNVINLKILQNNYKNLKMTFNLKKMLLVPMMPTQIYSILMQSNLMKQAKKMKMKAMVPKTY